MLVLMNLMKPLTNKEEGLLRFYSHMMLLMVQEGFQLLYIGVSISIFSALMHAQFVSVASIFHQNFFHPTITTKIFHQVF
jgi:hypothetical protein